MTFLYDMLFVGVLCTSSIVAFLCLFHSKIQKRYGLSSTALTYMTMSCAIAGCVICAIMHEVD